MKKMFGLFGQDSKTSRKDAYVDRSAAYCDRELGVQKEVCLRL